MSQPDTTSDILADLRGFPERTYASGRFVTLCDRAADEIERLRERVRLLEAADEGLHL